MVLLEDYTSAIEDFNAAISVLSNHWTAYYLRGRYTRYFWVKKLKLIHKYESIVQMNTDESLEAYRYLDKAMNDFLMVINLDSEIKEAFYQFNNHAEWDVQANTLAAYHPVLGAPLNISSQKEEALSYLTHRVSMEEHINSIDL